VRSRDLLNTSDAESIISCVTQKHNPEKNAKGVALQLAAFNERCETKRLRDETNQLSSKFFLKNEGDRIVAVSRLHEENSVIIDKLIGA
jgi:hypothetical protein